MTGQRRLRSTTIGRVAIGLLTAGVLLAPVAAATPQSDAGDAITAAWQAGGGDTGPLGPKDGDVYAVGAGFGQNFAGGKIFYTPPTGAHIVMGAILDKYLALGGPADSDLGFPTIDEGPGRAADSRNTTFSAGDHPVIFWTPATGARVVRGAINAAWDKLGGSAGVLGVPAEDEAYRGGIVTQKFTGGTISYDAQNKSFTTDPPDLAGQLADLAIPDDPTSAINAARRAAGGALGPLGAAQGAPYSIGPNGTGQNFAGGKIFYTPSTGAAVVTGPILAKYESVGGPEGDLGFPTASEADGGLAPASRVVSFAADDKPVIFWTPDYGAIIVRGAMNAAWQKLGGATGALGAPMADQSENGDVITQRFGGGAVSWDRAKKTFSTEPSKFAADLAGVQVPGQQTPKAPHNAQPANTNGKKWFGFKWWWLLAIVPVVVLAGLIGFATLRSRHRGGDDHLFDDQRADDHLFDDQRADDQRADDQRADDRRGLGVPPSQVPEPPSAAEFAAGLLGRPLRDDATAPTAAGGGRLPPAPISLWGAPDHADEPVTAREPVLAPPAPPHPEPPLPEPPHPEPPHPEQPLPEPPQAQQPQPEDEDPDKVDTAPTRVVTPVERDPLTDTGRHARIEIDQPNPSATALHLPLEDPGRAPEGYPVKANTRSGLYWAPGSAHYDDAHAEIWFASEEFAITNGFVRGDQQ